MQLTRKFCTSPDSGLQTLSTNLPNNINTLNYPLAVRQRLSIECLNKIFRARGERSIHTNSNIDRLNPFYVSGFADGESSFTLSIVKRSNVDTG